MLYLFKSMLNRYPDELNPFERNRFEEVDLQSVEPEEEERKKRAQEEKEKKKRERAEKAHHSMGRRFRALKRTVTEAVRSITEEPRPKEQTLGEESIDHWLGLGTSAWQRTKK